MPWFALHKITTAIEDGRHVQFKEKYSVRNDSRPVCSEQTPVLDSSAFKRMGVENLGRNTHYTVSALTIVSYSVYGSAGPQEVAVIGQVAALWSVR